MSHLYRKFSCDESDICCSTFGRINRQLLVSCDSDNKVHLWNIPQNKYLNILAQCKSSVQSVCFDSKELNLCFGSSCGSIVLYSVESSKVYCSLPNGHKEAINGVDFHPYGTYFGSSSNDCVLKVWDVRNKRSITQLKESTTPINTIKWSPDGSWIVLFSCDGSFSKMFDVIGGRVVYQFEGVYTGDFHPHELVLCTVSSRKARTRRSSNICTIEVWDLQQFTLISQLDVDADSQIKMVYFSTLKSNAHASLSNLNSNDIYLFVVSDTKIYIYLWDPVVLLVYTRDINQPFINELSVVDGVMMTSSIVENSSILWIHDFSKVKICDSGMPDANCDSKLAKPHQVCKTSPYTDTDSEPKTPIPQLFNPTISTPKNSNIFGVDSKFKTSTVVRKNLKAPTVIDSSQERRQSVDGSIRMAMEKHLLRNTFILSPGSRATLPSDNRNESNLVVMDEIVENAPNFDDTLDTSHEAVFAPNKNSTMSSDSFRELSSKTMILRKRSNTNLTLTTDHLLSSGIQKSSNNLANVSFYGNYDNRHVNVINHLKQKIENVTTINLLISSNADKNGDVLRKLLDSIATMNDLDSLKILVSKTTNLQQHWTLEVCRTFLDCLSNRILKRFNAVEVVCVVKKIISKIIVDHGDTLKDKSSNNSYKKNDLKLECKQFMKRISCILASVDDKNLQMREQIDAKEIRYLIRSVVGSG